MVFTVFSSCEGVILFTVPLPNVEVVVVIIVVRSLDENIWNNLEKSGKVRTTLDRSGKVWGSLEKS